MSKQEKSQYENRCSSCGTPQGAGHTPECTHGKEGEGAMPTSVDLYVFRHAKSERKESTYAKEEGRWASWMRDITEEGGEKVRAHAEEVAQELDPKRHVVILLSSPRARALTTERILKEVFVHRGFATHYFSDDAATGNILRSGGDASAGWGEGNVVARYINEKSDDESVKVVAGNTGKRFREFLSLFAAIDPKRFAQWSKEKFGGKVPVFIAVTHGEVVAGERTREASFRQSFLGKVFPERAFLEEGTRLHSGNYFKLSFDLQHPSTQSTAITFEQKDKSGVITKQLQYDQHTGEVALDRDGGNV